MGQRTTIILIAENEKNDRVVRVYYDQWGIGRKPFLNLLSVHHAIYNRRYGEPLTEIMTLDNVRSKTIPMFIFTYTKHKKSTAIDFDGDQIKCPKFDTFTDPKRIGKFIDSHCDNNNGAMVIRIKDLGHYSYDFSVGFLMGHEDEPYDSETNPEGERAFSRWLTMDEYAKLPINRMYADDGFMKIINDFCRYFGIYEIR